MKATVKGIYDNPEGKFGANVCAVLDIGEADDYRLYENKYQSAEADFLRGLSRGDTVHLREETVTNPKTGERMQKLKIDHAKMAMEGAPAPAEKKTAVGKAEALELAKKRMAFFYTQAEEMCKQADVLSAPPDLNAAAYTLMRLTKDIMEGRE